MAEFCFWTSVALIVYCYFGYGLCLYLCKKMRPAPIRKAAILPDISMIMAVYNEENNIERKLNNLLAIDYPSDRIEILIISDGSTDGTNALLAEAIDPRIFITIADVHRGKPAALNQAVSSAKGEILIFSDARQNIEPGAIRHLVANFADRDVGCVSGELMLIENATSARADIGFYWRIEKKIRQLESDTGSVVGVTGALYAIRKSLMPTIPHDTVLDDVHVPLRVIQNGYRVVFEPRAKVTDRVQNTEREFRRKVRTLTGNYQLIRFRPGLLSRTGPVLFRIISHKLLRLAVPFALIVLLVTSILVTGIVYKTAAAVQVGFYILAAVGSRRTTPGRLTRMARVAFSFVLLNGAALSAFFNFATGRLPAWVR
jgi:biofilm PGA synthesis N-glycosyltransferase PgaC